MKTWQKGTYDGEGSDRLQQRETSLDGGKGGEEGGPEHAPNINGCTCKDFFTLSCVCYGGLAAPRLGGFPLLLHSLNGSMGLHLVSVVDYRHDDNLVVTHSIACTISCSVACHFFTSLHVVTVLFG